MAATLETIEQEALTLSDADRTQLIERLLASLDPDPEIDGAWLVEAKRRDEEIESGEVKALPGEEVLARLKAEFRWFSRSTLAPKMIFARVHTDTSVERAHCFRSDFWLSSSEYWGSFWRIQAEEHH
jgi:putative addiction module component (TIGR02574 family)